MSNMTKEQLSENLYTVKPYEAHCSKSESRKTKIQDQSVDSMEHLIQRFQQEAEARETILSNNLLSALDARLGKIPKTSHRKPTATIVSAEYDFPVEKESEGERYEENENMEDEQSEEESDYDSSFTEPPQKKPKNDTEGEAPDKETRVYLESLETVKKFCPEALGVIETHEELIDATESLRFIKKKPRPKKQGLLLANCFKEKFLHTHRRIADPVRTKKDAKGYGNRALVNPHQFVKPQRDKRRIVEDPIELRLDLETNPPIIKKKHKLFDSKFNEIQAAHVDNACYQLNHLEWAQLSALKKLENMQEKYQENSELTRDIQELGSILDLTGNNLARLESTMSDLKSNIVLNERDDFLASINRNIPSDLIKRARIQPILENGYLIGEEMTEKMSKTLETTASQFAYEITKDRTYRSSSKREYASRGRAKPSRGSRAFNKPRDDDKHKSSSSHYQKSEDKSGERKDDSSKPTGRGRGRGFARGRGRDRGGSSSRRRPFNRD